MIPRCPRTSGALETANSVNECVCPREVLKRRNRRSASNEKPAQAVTVAQSASTVYHDSRGKPIRHRRYFLDPCSDWSEPSGHAVHRRLRAEPVTVCASATPRQKTRHILPPAPGETTSGANQRNHCVGCDSPPAPIHSDLSGRGSASGSSTHQHTAAHVDGRARHVTGAGRRQKDNHGSDFLRYSDSS